MAITTFQPTIDVVHSRHTHAAVLSSGLQPLPDQWPQVRVFLMEKPKMTHRAALLLARIEFDALNAGALKMPQQVRYRVGWRKTGVIGKVQR